MRRFLVATAAFTAVLLGGLSLGTVVGRPPAASAAVLEGFEGCDELLAWLRQQGAQRVSAWGLDGAMGFGGGAAVQFDALAADAAGDSAAGAVSAAPPALPLPSADQRSAEEAGGADSGAFSGTNVQEAGIDEPDLVKTDGRRIYTISGNRLVVTDVTGPQPRPAGSLDLAEGWSHELVLSGDRLLVITRGHAAAPGGATSMAPVPEPDGRGVALDMIAPGPMGTPQTVLTVVDVAGAPAVVATRTLDAEYVSARLIDGVLRLVLRTGGPRIPIVFPQEGNAAAEQTALEANRAAVASSTISDWLPTEQVDGTARPLVDCAAVRRPAEPAGVATVSVVSVAFTDGEPAVSGGATVVADGQTVYASPRRLYVALPRWDAAAASTSPDTAVSSTMAGAASTDIHAFDITDPTEARYVASGRVDGTLLNQWALSEHEGHLRVATTVEPWMAVPLPAPDIAPAPGTDPVEPGRQAPASSSSVVVLAEQGDALAEVGRVDGLGVTERIQAVRYLGDLAYVVTFRQTDPLYIVDLSVPAAPRVRGELKIPGYSAYLHPVGDGLLLGVGQDATEEGRVTGAQVSLFDVADPSAPRRVSQITIGGSSEVEFDARAFLWWAPSRLAVVPVQQWEPGTFTGAVGLTVEGAELRERGRVAAPQGFGAGCPGCPPDALAPASIRRSVVVGERLYAIADGGLVVVELATFAPVAQLAF